MPDPIREAVEAMNRLSMGEPVPAECPRCGSLDTAGDGAGSLGCRTCGLTVLPGIRVNDPPVWYDREGRVIG